MFWSFALPITRANAAAAAALAVLAAAGPACGLDRSGTALSFGEPAADGGGGAPTGCTAPGDCPGPDLPCQERACTAGACGFANAAAGTACTGPEAGAKLCDGLGKCVQCLGPADCGGNLCQRRKCVPPTCADGIVNGDETDVDCGGLECAPCPNDRACKQATDCISHFCTPSATCAACGKIEDCSGDEYCDEGVCAPRKQNGDTCKAGTECQNGSCPAQDGVCCNFPCLVKCRACLGAKTGGENGACLPIPAKSDPDKDCPKDDAETCKSTGEGCNGNANNPGCILYSNETVCSPAACEDGTLTEAGKCDGLGSCVAGTKGCGAYTCNKDGNACLDGCFEHAQCASGHYCGSQKCLVKKASGQPCSSAAVCLSGYCQDGVCCDKACDGACVACVQKWSGKVDGACGACQGSCVGGKCCGEAVEPSQQCPGGCPPAGVPGSCGSKTCTITCSGSQACKDKTITCPPGQDCVVKCTGSQACKGATIKCPELHKCSVSCEFANAQDQSCQGATISCSAQGPCSLTCGASQACKDTKLVCGNNACSATCQGGEKPIPTCGSSCNCTPC
ncbi:MAG: hypothetical protein HY744_04760 [Deltaproteobacteria bacterium]|nr:hypothetical protein [Deltaproteobacteria bacterium]